MLNNPNKPYPLCRLLSALPDIDLKSFRKLCIERLDVDLRFAKHDCLLLSVNGRTCNQIVVDMII